MEYWNVDLKEEPLTTSMLAPMSRVIFPMNQCPISPKPIIPSFQYSLAQTPGPDLACQGGDGK